MTKETLDGERLRGFLTNEINDCVTEQVPGNPNHVVIGAEFAEKAIHRVLDELPRFRTPSPGVELREGHAVVDVGRIKHLLAELEDANTEIKRSVMAAGSVQRPMAEARIEVVKTIRYEITAHTLTNKNTEENGAD